MNNVTDAMKEDVMDEGQGLIQQGIKQARPLGPRALVSSLTHRASTTSDDDEFENVPLRHQQNHSKTTSPFVRTLVVAILCFALGLGVSYYSTTFTYLVNTIEGLPTLDAYGVPRDLPRVPLDQLINRTELALRTGFVVSREPTVRTYEFNISHGLGAPDGVWKPMILANGQSPGPLLEANMGDMIRVTVNNLMPNTSTSIHFHGINQGNSTWMDGVAGVNQCGIPGGGGTWTYEFVVTNQRGTFWWHAHTAVQFTDGLFGPIVVHDPDEQVPDADEEQILFLGENYHRFAAELAARYLSPSSPWSPDEAGVEPLSDNFLLNGQNTWDCAMESTTWPTAAAVVTQQQCTGGQLYTTTIQPGSTVRLRLINHSSYFSYWFSIDSHNLTIVEMDGVEIEPMVSTGVHVNIGQRYSVLINATQDAGDYAIQQTLERECFLPFSTYRSNGLESIQYEVKGVLRYKGFEGVTKRKDGSNPNPWGCQDLPFDKPVPKRPEAAYTLGADDPEHILDFEFRQAGEVNRIFLNRTSWAPYRDDALLWQALDQNFSVGEGGSYNNWGFRLDQQVSLIPDGSQTVQVVLNSLDVMEHPFHMQYVYVIEKYKDHADPFSSLVVPTLYHSFGGPGRYLYIYHDRPHCSNSRMGPWSLCRPFLFGYHLESRKAHAS